MPQKKGKSFGKKTNKSGRDARPGKPLTAVFWTAFFIVVAALFLLNREKIRETLEETRFMERVFKRPSPSMPSPEFIPDLSPEQTVSVPVQRAPDSPPEQSGGGSPQTPSAEKAPESGDSLPEQASPAAKPESPPKPTENLRDRNLYFIRVDGDGTIVRVKSPRKLPASNSPLLDSMKALLKGPGPEEKARGLISLIPPGTRILNALVQGNTAYINMSEDFLFNTYGVQGYEAQLEQLVWTATEFPNVKDLQILIEGRRVDYLGESVWIGSPLGRENF